MLTVVQTRYGPRPATPPPSTSAWSRPSQTAIPRNTFQSCSCWCLPCNRSSNWTLNTLKLLNKFWPMFMLNRFKNGCWSPLIWLFDLENGIFRFKEISIVWNTVWFRNSGCRFRSSADPRPSAGIQVGIYRISCRPDIRHPAKDGHWRLFSAGYLANILTDH